MYHLVLNRIFILLFIFIYASVANALQGDNKATLYIVADSYLGNSKTGIKIFEGHVKVDQGTTHITADRLVTKSNAERKIQEATAYGLQELAHYWTIPKLGDPEIHARAKIIKFYPIESNATLEQDVHVTQGANSFQGELIHYNGNDETITVPHTKNARAVLVYNPPK